VSDTVEPTGEPLSAERQALLALRRLRARLDAVERARTEPIAVVGLGCRFPGADGPEAFWRLLCDGVDAIREVPPERWDLAAWYDPDPDAPGKTYSRHGGFLEGVDRFDADFFGISPREAASLDPQQRLFLEVAWHALEDAGIAPGALAGTPAGVFAGVSFNDYAQLQAQRGAPDRLDAYMGTGKVASLVANRLSYALDLRGPSVALDTGCSSSLVAVHLACQSLRSGESSLALVGGVNLILAPENTVIFSKARMLAPDGRCKSFDAAADGYVRSEGCGVVILERLSDAVAAGHRVLAVIRGSAVRQDGRTSGLTVPSEVAQAAVIRDALATAGVEPAALDLVETHGTGTSLGDPIEVQGLAAALGAAAGRTPDRPLVLGAVKTNLGHLESAAGIAGLIKVVLALHHGEIPPNLHFREPNPHLDLDAVPAVVPVRRLPWPAADEDKRLAGVSSFGFGGAIAHVVLGGAPPSSVEASAEAERPLHVLPLSARSAAALRRLAESFRDRLAEEPELPAADLCATAGAGRSHFAHRLAAVAGSTEELRRRLDAFLAGEEEPGLVRGARPAGGDPPRIAFLFTGQGGQLASMGLRLREAHPVFRAALDRCAEILRPWLPRPLLEILASPLDDTALAQPALVALEIALAELWRSWGVTPSLVFGHSVGEIAAACVAGALTPEAALALAAERGRLMSELAPPGSMAAVFAPRAQVEAAPAPWSTRLSVAAVNGPLHTVIAGDPEAVTAVCQTLAAEGVESRPLRTARAFHSPLLDGMLEPLEHRAAELAGTAVPPRLGWVSGLGGRWMDQTPDALHWRQQARQPVDFAAAFAALRNAGAEIFVEVGPEPTLLGMAGRMAPDDGLALLPSLRPHRDEVETMLGSLAGLYARGVEVDWAGFDRPWRRQRVALPVYPFERQRFWFEEAPAAEPLYRVAWVQAPSPSAPARPPGRWLIVSDGGGFAEALAARLEEAGEHCEIAPPESTVPVEPLRGIVHLAALAAPAPEAAATPDEAVAALQTAAGLGCGVALDLARALASREGGSRLWLVSRGAQGADGRAVEQSPLWGFGRVVALEMPERWGGLVDLDPAEGPAEAAARLAAELLAGNEGEVAFHNGRRLVPRLEPILKLTAAETPPPIHPDATYLITGGTGGIGLLLSAWLVARGARHLALVSRRPPDPAGRERIADLERAGARILVLSADVSRPAELSAALDRVRAELPPLRGVFHLAGTLDDAVLPRQDRERLARVFAPKVEGAWNLHRLTLGDPLDLFVLFSSLASLLGSRGQANYAAANAFLEGLARLRRVAGLPAVSLHWGPWAEAGMAASLGDPQRWAAQGLEPLASARALEILGTLLHPGDAGVAVLPGSWATRLRRADAPPLLRALLAGSPPLETSGRPASFRRLLERTPMAERPRRLAGLVRSEINRVLGHPEDHPLPPRQGLFDSGLDSLMAVELRNRLQARLDGDAVLATTVVFDHPTPDALAALLERLVLGSEVEAAPALPVPVDPAEPIAVVGLGCRFPGGADSPAAFWRLLVEGVDAVGELPLGRWDRRRFQTPCGGFLDRVDLFDPYFFGIAPREAASLDPQQRLLLEVAWEALEDALLPPARLAGSRTGVFVGIGSSDYAQLQARATAPADIDAYWGTGAAPSAAAGRLSYLLGVHGPSLAVDTACSSSLVAVHLACQSLRGGECDLALAAGVHLMLAPETGVFLSRAHALSPDGRCKAFSAAADGYGRGEGCGVVVLKRLSDARRDGDAVLALIRGSAVNQDGRSVGLTAPHGPSQEAVIRQALAAAGLPPAAVSYVEAHGTGTPLGDPIEIEALAAALGAEREPDRPLQVGSVKTNLGHLEAAAGIAGLLKVVLSLRHRKIPAHLHLDAPNPRVRWNELPVTVPTALADWPSADGPRVAGVSSFGFVGTNAHVILEEAPDVPVLPEEAPSSRLLLPISARSEEALAALAGRYAALLEAAPESWADVCRAAARGRSHFEHRLAVVASSGEEAARRLAALDGARGWADPGALPREIPASLDLEQVARLWVEGAEIDWERIFGKGFRRVTLPSYPFQRQRYWLGSGLGSPEAVEENVEPVGEGHIVAGLYDSLSAAYRQPGSMREQGDEGFLTFALLPRPVPGFAYLPAYFYPERHPEHARLLRAGQRAIREVLFRPLDLTALGSVLDFGCGYGADLIRLATENPGLRAHGYTLSAGQAAHGNDTARRLGLGDRVAVFHRDSARDAFPGTYDLVFGLEVAGLIADKEALFRNVGDHLIDGGWLLLADFVADMPEMENAETSSFTSTPEVWSRCLAASRLRLDECVDVSAEVAHSLDDPDFESHLAEAGRDLGLTEAALRHIGSYANIGRALRKGLIRYVLMRARRDRSSRPAEIERANLRRLARPTLFAEIEEPPGLAAAAGEAWRDMLYEVEWRPAALPATVRPPDAAELAADMVPRLAALRDRLDLPRRARLEEGLETLAHAWVVRALERVPAEDVVPRHRRLFGRLLAIRAEGGSTAADPEALLAELRARHPEGEAELNLLGRCGAALDAVLRGARDPLDLLYPGGSLADTERLYRESLPARALNELAAEAVAAAVGTLPAGRAPRLLEIGGGTGGTTAALLPRLPRSTAAPIEYLFTDISPRFLAQAEESFSAWPFVRYRRLDISLDPVDQGFPPGSFDVVVAANVLHATPDLRRTVAHAARLLAPGGLLVLWEGCGRQRWVDLIFGLTEGWWSFADPDLRPDHPLLARDAWCEVLAEAGLHAATLPESGSEEAGLARQALILARAPRTESRPWLVLADRGGVADALAEKLAARGVACRLVQPGGDLDPVCPEDFQMLAREAREMGGPVLHLWGLDASADDLVRDQELGCASLLHLVQGIAGSGAPPPGLWVVTRGAQGAGSESALAPSQALAWGLARVAALEHPDLRCVRVDLDPDAGDRVAEADAILAEVEAALAGAPREDEVAWRSGQRRTARLARSPLASQPQRELSCRPEATWLITGGLGGLGLEVAERLVARGARHLALAGRSAPGEAAVRRLDALRSVGVRIEVWQADVAQPEEVDRLLAQVAAALPPLAGVIHSVGVLDDGVLLQQDWSRFRRVLAPKVDGAWALARATAGMPLEHFVLFSSGAALLGSPGQGNHAAANAFLDTLAHACRRAGRPGVSLAWGAWQDVGAAAARRIDAQIGRRGLGSFSPAEGLAALEHALDGGPAHLGIVPVDWPTFLETWPAGDEPSLFRDLASSRQAPVRQTTERPATPAPPAVTLRTRLDEAPAAERRSLLQEHLERRAAAVLGVGAGRRIDARLPLQDLGLDSLMAIELRNALGRDLGEVLPATLLFDHPTVTGLADFLAPRLFGTGAAAEEPRPAGDVDTDLEALAALSDDEAVLLLTQHLDALERGSAL
jgi:acyl transferase domain-containing protein/SAM-dependent methyltransferase/acyl carrier protein/aryl carrier-like protein